MKIELYKVIILVIIAMFLITIGINKNHQGFKRVIIFEIMPFLTGMAMLAYSVYRIFSLTQ